jgi:hypothetical protein
MAVGTHGSPHGSDESGLMHAFLEFRCDRDSRTKKALPDGMGRHFGATLRGNLPHFGTQQRPSSEAQSSSLDRCCGNSLQTAFIANTWLLLESTGTDKDPSHATKLEDMHRAQEGAMRREMSPNCRAFSPRHRVSFFHQMSALREHNGLCLHPQRKVKHPSCPWHKASSNHGL